MEHVQAADREGWRATVGEIGFHCGTRPPNHKMEIPHIPHTNFHLFLAGFKQTIAQPFTTRFFQRLRRLRSDILEGSRLRVPVIHCEFKTVDLLDIILVRELNDIAEHIAWETCPFDLDLKVWDIKMALALCFLGYGK